MKYISVWQETVAQAVERREDEKAINRVAICISLWLILICLMQGFRL
jgi:hypothetical protein